VLKKCTYKGTDDALVIKDHKGCDNESDKNCPYKNLKVAHGRY
jgi:hypothetical protein